MDKTKTLPADVKLFENSGYGWNATNDDLSRFSDAEIAELWMERQILRNDGCIAYKLGRVVASTPAPANEPTQLWENCDHCGRQPSYATARGHRCADCR